MATSLPDARWLTTSSFFIEAYAATILGNLQSRVRGDRARRRAREQKRKKNENSNRYESRGFKLYWDIIPSTFARYNYYFLNSITIDSVGMRLLNSCTESNAHPSHSFPGFSSRLPKFLFFSTCITPVPVLGNLQALCLTLPTTNE